MRRQVGSARPTPDLDGPAPQKLRALIDKLVEAVGIEHREEDCRAEKRRSTCFSCQTLREVRKALGQPEPPRWGRIP